MSTGGFRVIAAAGCQVSPNTGEKVVGILSVDLPFWSVVTFDETHRKSLNLEPNDRVGFGSIVLPLGKLWDISIWRERGAREGVHLSH